MHWKNGHGSVSVKWLVILSEFVTERDWFGWISHNIFHGQEKFIWEFISHWSSLLIDLIIRVNFGPAGLRHRIFGHRPRFIRLRQSILRILNPVFDWNFLASSRISSQGNGS